MILDLEAVCRRLPGGLAFQIVDPLDAIGNLRRYPGPTSKRQAVSGQRHVGGSKTPSFAFRDFKDLGFLHLDILVGLSLELT